MVTPATSHLDPPKSWDELEEICADLFGREWKDNNTTRYGRQGQRQNGVDIYGRRDGGKYVGVQCKGRSKWPPSPLTTKQIDEEVAKAKNFTPKLTEYVIATVDPNDYGVQDHARKITEEHEKEGLFSVHVVAWPELTRRLTQHSELIAKHYGYVGNAEIQQGVKDLPDRVVRAIREQLPALGTTEQRGVMVSVATAADPSIAQAMERDLATRFDIALRRSMAPEAVKRDEFQDLADAVSEPQYAAVSATLRQRVLLRASRSASIRGFLERAKALLTRAQALSGEESDVPARARIAEAEGDLDGAIALLRLYQTTGTVEALRSLLASVGKKGDHRAVAQYSEQLYQRTKDPHDVVVAARALSILGDRKELIRIMDSHPSIAERDTDLARDYGWRLFQIGRLKDAKAIARRLQKHVPIARDLQLEIAIAIESGEWESLDLPLGAFLDDVRSHSALDLIRAAHLAQASGRGPMLDLLKAAIAKNEPDANVWLGAYLLVMDEGLEGEMRESRQWFERALELSGTDGPIHRFELKELLPQQQEWNKRTRSISDCP